MKKLLLLLGFLAGTAHAADEYYTLQPALTTAPCASNNYEPCVGSVTVSGWFETDGYGKSNESGGVGSPGYNSLIIDYDLQWTYGGVTETYSSGPDSAVVGLVATPKGLFCDQCSFQNTDSNYGYFDYEAHSVQYQFGNGTGAGGLSFLIAPLPDNYMIAAPASTTIPGAPELDPRAAGSALMLLAGIALVLKGRRRV